MKKIEGTARFDNEQDAQTAVNRLFELRHGTDNEIDGGAVELHGTEVRFSLRVRKEAAKAAADRAGKQIDSALKGADVDKAHDEVQYDEETYVDRDTGEIKTQLANRVVQVYTDDNGQEQTRVLRSSTRMVRAVDDETGEEMGRIPVRTVTDEHGNKVVFGGDRGTPEQNVVVETA